LREAGGCHIPARPRTSNKSFRQIRPSLHARAFNDLCSIARTDALGTIGFECRIDAGFVGFEEQALSNVE
jgi:hypothetical protein